MHATPPNCLRILHRDGTASTIPMVRDQRDDTKWIFAEPVALEVHETADLIVDGQVVDQLRHEPGRASVPVNTFFYSLPDDG